MRLPSGFAVGLGAELGGNVLRPPGEADEPRAAIAISAGGEQAGGSLHRLRQDLDMARGQAGLGFARGQLGVDFGDGGRALGFRKQYGIRLARHDGVEIGVGHAGVEPVDAHQQARALLGGDDFVEEFERGGARHVLALGRDRILEIEDDAVGAAGESLVELGPAVGGNEEQGTHQ